MLCMLTFLLLPDLTEAVVRSGRLGVSQMKVPSNFQWDQLQNAIHCFDSATADTWNLGQNGSIDAEIAVQRRLGDRRPFRIWCKRTRKDWRILAEFASFGLLIPHLGEPFGPVLGNVKWRFQTWKVSDMTQNQYALGELISCSLPQNGEFKEDLNPSMSGLRFSPNDLKRQAKTMGWVRNRGENACAPDAQLQWYHLGELVNQRQNLLLAFSVEIIHYDATMIHRS